MASGHMFGIRVMSSAVAHTGGCGPAAHASARGTEEECLKASPEGASESPSSRQRRLGIGGRGKLGYRDPPPNPDVFLPDAEDPAAVDPGLSAWAAIKNYQRQRGGGLKREMFISHSSGGWNSKVKHRSHPEASSLSLEVATLLLGARMTPSLCSPEVCERSGQERSGVSSHEGTNPIVGPHPNDLI